MRWTRDCHGIRFHLVCGGCYAKIMEEKRTCQVCQKEFPKSSMRWTRDCHGIPFRLVCCECYEKVMEGNAFDGEYYTEADEWIDEDQQTDV